MNDRVRRMGLAPQPLGARTRVMIEPPDRETAERVLKKLQEIGATRVREVTEGFISAEIPTQELESIETIARTGILPVKRLHQPGRRG
jgi:hypothetical protein